MGASIMNFALICLVADCFCELQKNADFGYCVWRVLAWTPKTVWLILKCKLNCLFWPLNSSLKYFFIYQSIHLSFWQSIYLFVYSSIHSIYQSESSVVDWLAVSLVLEVDHKHIFDKNMLLRVRLIYVHVIVSLHGLEMSFFKD